MYMDFGENKQESLMFIILVLIYIMQSESNIIVNCVITPHFVLKQQIADDNIEDQLRELGSLSLENRRLWKNFIAVFQFSKVTYKKDRLCIMVCSNRRRDNVFKLKKDKFKFQIMKIFFTMREVKLWNRFPRMLACSHN